jgi:NADH-quinone oxidoreductase subunit N
MNLMAASADLVMLYLAIETTSIPLYVLAGFMLSDKQSTEAGFKYLLFGAMTSAIMLYGFSLLFGFAGTTNLYELASMAVAGQLSLGVALGLVMLIVVGLGFKVSIVPFHFWAPDVYTGAPTPVAGFLSTASKAAGFAVLTRLFSTVFEGSITPITDLAFSWASILAVLAAITMTLGNLVALKQTNIKRLLAYSSIAHAGLCHDRRGGSHKSWV